VADDRIEGSGGEVCRDDIAGAPMTLSLTAIKPISPAY
jgi:hypothetical protein